MAKIVLSEPDGPYKCSIDTEVMAVELAEVFLGVGWPPEYDELPWFVPENVRIRGGTFYLGPPGSDYPGEIDQDPDGNIVDFYHGGTPNASDT